MLQCFTVSYLIKKRPNESNASTSVGNTQKSDSSSKNSNSLPVDLEELVYDPGLRPPIGSYDINIQDNVRCFYLQKGACQLKDMKRKKGSKAGYKKGKQKIKLTVNDSTTTPPRANSEDTQDMGGNEDGQIDSNMNSESPLSVSDKPNDATSLLADMATEVFSGKPGHARVKVRIKSSRPLKSNESQPDVRSDASKSNTKLMQLVQGHVTGNREDASSDGPTPDVQKTNSVKSSRKSGSIKIIASRGIGSSSTIMEGKHYNNQSNSMQTPDERILVISDNERTTDSSASKKSHQCETKTLHFESSDNEKELKASLTVIKKIMKMDAAEPFNAPVDPIALGIPDYFDVIHTPMDFGTICSNLELGHKYLNSKDVFKDVQFIWNNCCKYNNKGDYIIDLMRRVKKNFMKYWTASGLFSGCTDGDATESLSAEDSGQPNQEKSYVKEKSSKLKRKRHGIETHKIGCLCAACVMRRRSNERKQKLNGNQVATTDTASKLKEEGHSPVDNPDNEQSSPSQDQSMETSSHADLEGPGKADLGIVEQQNSMQVGTEIPGLNISEIYPEKGFDVNEPSRGQGSDLSNMVQPDGHKNYMQEESKKMLDQIKLYEDSSHQKNHSIVEICSTLFSNDPTSLWNGPHSLSRRINLPSFGDNPIHAALSKFLKH